MPEFPKISRADFLRALDVWLNNLQDAMERKEWGVWSFIKDKMPWWDSPKEYTENLYNEILDVVDVQGVGPWIPHYSDIVGARIERFDEEQLREFALKTVQEDFDNRLALGRFELSQQQFAENKRQFEVGETRRTRGELFQKEQAQREFGFGMARLGMEERASMQNLQAQQANLFTQRFANVMNPPDLERRLAESERGRQFEWFERQRQNILFSLQNTPGAFIKTFQIKQAQNPFAPLGEQGSAGGAEDVQRLQEQVDRFKPMATEIRARMKDPDDPLTRTNVANPETQMEQQASILLEQFDKAKGDLLTAQITHGQEVQAFEAKQAKSIADFGYASEAGEDIPRKRQFVLPELPKELIGFVTPWNRLTGEIGKVVSSGSAFARLPFSAKKQLYGILEYQGKVPYEFSWERAPEEAPIQPSRGMGGGTRFAPFRQRAGIV